MNYAEFCEKLTNFTPDGNFSFGFNWLDYVERRVNESIINSHLEDLKAFYANIDKAGSVIDIGSGSGLSSLCFRKLGFEKVFSVDFDEHSVTAANVLMRKYGADLDQSVWQVERNSILNRDFVLEHQGAHQVVYSWGCLHHTGNMWQAIRNAASMVKPGGYFHVTLYRSGDQYTEHSRLKYRYDMLDVEGKKNLLYNYLNILYFKNNIDVFSAKDERGMNFFNDALDWLGGTPYEVCDPDVMNSYMWSLGFIRVKFRDSGQGGPYVDFYQRRK